MRKSYRELNTDIVEEEKNVWIFIKVKLHINERKVLHKKIDQLTNGTI